jgi:thiosulfate dehydrogenase (quinone) large subunit
MADEVVRTPRGRVIHDPPVIQTLFNNTRFSFIWLIVRVLLGLAWIEQATHKLGDPAWMQTGEALKAFWTNAVKVPENARPPIAFPWYRDFIQSMLDQGSYVWFGKLVAIGELLVGIALILGLFTGIAAFIGAFMNWNYVMAGSASTNPILMVASILLILAWKTAGYYGLDRYIVPRLGATWEDTGPARAPVRQPDRTTVMGSK